jgi:hypothetical protein
MSIGTAPSTVPGRFGLPEVHAQVDALQQWVCQSAQDGTSAHVFERGLFDKLLALGKTLFQAFLKLVGPGDFGPAVTLDDGGDGFQLKLLRQRRELPLPKIPHHGVAEPRDDGVTEPCVGQDSKYREQRRSRNFEQRQNRIAQDMFHPWSPELAIQFLKRANNARRDKGPLLPAGTVQQVERQGMACVGRVEEDHVVRTVPGDGGKQRIAQIAVRVEERDAAAGADERVLKLRVTTNRKNLAVEVQIKHPTPLPAWLFRLGEWNDAALWVLRV